MPFTVSHAIVAVPFRRTPLPVAAVAIGAMAPDAVLFVPWLPPYAYAHSWVGVATVDLAVALVVLAAWWWLVRPAWSRVLSALLPVRFASATTRPERVPLRRLPWVVLGALVGSVTHVVWDAFSHPHGWVVLRVPALRAEYAGHPGSSIVQDASSVIGLLALVLLAVAWWRRQAGARDGAGRVRPAGPVGPTGSVHTGREARVLLVACVAVVGLVTLGRLGLAVLVGGTFTDLVVTAAFVLPPTIAVVLVLGAVAGLVVVRRWPSGTDGQERREVGA